MTTTATLDRLEAAARFPRMAPSDSATVLAARPDATDVRPYVAWLHADPPRRPRHGEHGIVLGPNRHGSPRARVFDIDQTDPEPSHPSTTLPAVHQSPVADHSPAPAGAHTPGGDHNMKLFTCSYTEFRENMGVPVRFTVGYPRFLKLDYKIVGWARLPTPTKDILSLPLDAYTVAYRRILNTAGVDAIRAELAKLAPGADRVVLLCYERLNETDKTTGQPKWCHRRIFSTYWEETTGEEVPELGASPKVAAAGPDVLF
jgi:hypothetical protein